MSTLRVVWMVARREVKARMLTKANIISMSVIVGVIVIAALVGGYFLNRDGEPPAAMVAVEQEAAALLPSLQEVAARHGLDLQVAEMTAADARDALDPAVEGTVAIEAFLSGDPAAPRMLVESRPDPRLLEVVTAAVQSYVMTDQVERLGGDPSAFEQTLGAAMPQVESLTDPEDDEFDGPAFFVAMAMISLLFGSLIGTGSMIAMGVVEEKTSRVVEILLATIRPAQLLAGKILGIGIYGLFQIGVLGGTLAGAAYGVGLLDGIQVNVGSALVWLILWFLIGYAIYALLFGGFAALVSRQEDIGSVTTPLMFLLFVPFYATMFLVPNDPDSSIVQVLSQIPVFAPFMLPVRDAFGAVAPWEMALAVAIALATIPVLVWVAGRVYRRGVLHTGGRMKLSQALKG